MKAKKCLKAVGAVAGIVAIVLAGMLISSPCAQAQETEATLSQLGLAIAPVPLNLAGQDPTMVGLGSFFVNSIGGCNDCHTSGEPPIYVYPYATGGNPYFGQPQKTDPAVYLSGGMNFGPVGTPTGPLMYAGPDIISRNLTPDYTGMAEGGRTLSQFMQILTSGIDFDGIHPTCTAAQLAIINSPNVTQAELPNCIPTTPGINPVDGNLLQVMPWPHFSYLTAYDIQAIYEYLSAIPCINNTTSMPPAGAPNELLNTCPAAPANPITIVITGPGGATSATNTFQTNSNQISLNASQSTSAAGGLSYSWQSAPGFSTVGIPGGNTATPFVQLPGPGTYELILTVKDASGNKATATITLQYV